MTKSGVLHQNFLGEKMPTSSISIFKDS